MSFFKLHSPDTAGVCLILMALAALPALPAPVMAYELHGSVVNGTTDEPVASIVVKTVDPSRGMMAETEVTTDASGHFVAKDLDPDRPVYLVRVSYAGINYTDFVRYRGQNLVTMQLEVYEPTSSWDDVSVSVPHMMLTRRADTLAVDKFFQITNNTSPSRTVYGEDARFTIHLPEEMIELKQFNVTSLGIPLPLEPEATGEPGRYTVDYPIKPGVTRVAMSYEVPYAEGHYAYREPLEYDLDEVMIITGDPTLQVTSATNTIERMEDVEGFTAYRIAGLAKGSELALDIAGGSRTPRASPAQRTPPRVMTLPNPTHVGSIALALVIGLVLFALLFSAVSKPATPDEEEEVLRQRREELLGQLARLDDLHQTGTVSDRIYKLKRSELTSAIAQIYYRLSFDKGEDAATPREKKGTARV